LGLLYVFEGKYELAEAVLARVLDVRSRVLGGENPDTLVSKNNLALLFERVGRSGQAEKLFSHVLASRRRVLGSDHPDTLRVLDALGRIRLQERRYAEAEPVLREALAGQEKKTPDSWERFNSQSMLGAASAGQKRYGDAEPLLLSGYEGLLQRKATIPSYNRVAIEEAGERIVQLYQHWDKPEKADVWRDKLRASLISAPVQP
jgi:tetratricopeptide (TPR) repeat protein